MAGLKEIRRRIKSVTNTKKITYAMKLVSAAKLRKTQEAVMRSRAYTEALVAVLSDIIRARGNTPSDHPLMKKRDSVNRIHLIILGGARGLSGAYNTNVNRKIEAFYKEKQAQNPQVSISATIFGRKPAEYYRRLERKYGESFEALSEDPLAWPTDEAFLKIQDKFIAGEIDEVYLIFTRFKSVISVTATLDKLLPLESVGLSLVEKTEAAAGVTLYEPSEESVYNALLPRLLSSKIRQAALDSKASEHASRMTAMDAATKNASELLFNLTLTRNRLRQSGITNQLLDIVGGAEALN